MSHTRSHQVGTSIRSAALQDLLERLFAAHAHIRSDNGPEMTAHKLRKWLERRGVEPLYIEPGSPWQNGYGESFIGRLKDEHFDRELFTSLLEAQVVTEDWRIETWINPRAREAAILAAAH